MKIIYGTMTYTVVRICEVYLHRVGMRFALVNNSRLSPV
jgi:hypothetical protein